MKSCIKMVGCMSTIGAIIMLGFAAPAPAETIYEEAFANSTGVDIAIDDHASGWHARSELDAAAEVINPSGKITDREAKAARANGPDGSGGYLYFQAKNAQVADDTELITYVEETLDRSLYTIDSFAWQMRNDKAETLARAVVCIDDNWYASDATFSQSGSWAEQELAFSTDASAWRGLTFDMAGGPDSDIVVGDVLAAALPDGDITQFGVYLNNNGGDLLVARVDDFTVEATAVPEPATWLLLMVGLAGLGFARRRSAQ